MADGETKTWTNHPSKGFHRDDITDVSPTYFDHCGDAVKETTGCLSLHLKMPSLVHENHWQWATQPNPREASLPENILPLKKVVSFSCSREGFYWKIPLGFDIIWLMVTQKNKCYLIKYQGKTLVFAADLIQQ